MFVYPPYNWEMGVHDNISVLEMEQLCNFAQYILKPEEQFLYFVQFCKQGDIYCN